MFARFGDPVRFEIALSWREDCEPSSRRPADYGWSMGAVQLTVGGVNISECVADGAPTPFIGWYLAPLLSWLATNWANLLHEEDFAWHEKTGQPAAIACRRALTLHRGAETAASRVAYGRIQAWYFRHGLRSASAGGLFPDLFIRRMGDDIELSWGETPIQFAPKGFAFASAIGAVHLPVRDVAAPLWEALQWATANPPAMDDRFLADWDALCRAVCQVQTLDAVELDRSLDRRLYEKVHASFSSAKRDDLLLEARSESGPWIDIHSPAVAMFGGVTPDLQVSDIDLLRDVLIDAAGGEDSAKLANLVQDRTGAPLGVPHRDGYEFADVLLDDLDLLREDESFIDIFDICNQLNIRVIDRILRTDKIRGVAIAGLDFDPVILINGNHIFNKSEAGRRFTVAHELCHVLYDRTRARRVSHISGPWVDAGIEKRANAFAAYLLMPRTLIETNLGADRADDPVVVERLSSQLHVSESALVEHLYNLDFIDEWARDHLRTVFAPDKYFIRAG